MTLSGSSEPGELRFLEGGEKLPFATYFRSGKKKKKGRHGGGLRQPEVVEPSFRWYHLYVGGGGGEKRGEGVFSNERKSGALSKSLLEFIYADQKKEEKSLRNATSPSPSPKHETMISAPSFSAPSRRSHTRGGKRTARLAPSPPLPAREAGTGQCWNMWRMHWEKKSLRPNQVRVSNEARLSCFASFSYRGGKV